jgi:putative flippase GtrA
MIVERGLLKQGAAFLLVGAIGFIVDGGLLTFLVQGLERDVYSSRAISFVCATLTTWQLNRAIVFRANGALRANPGIEYGRYFLVQIFGALANLSVFFFLVTQYEVLLRLPIVPLALGACFGLVVNYTGARFWVFQGEE